jgi:hypothetical protein
MDLLRESQAAPHPEQEAREPPPNSKVIKPIGKTVCTNLIGSHQRRRPAIFSNGSQRVQTAKRPGSSLSLRADVVAANILSSCGDYPIRQATPPQDARIQTTNSADVGRITHRDWCMDLQPDPPESPARTLSASWISISRLPALRARGLFPRSPGEDRTSVRHVVMEINSSEPFPDDRTSRVPPYATKSIAPFATRNPCDVAA